MIFIVFSDSTAPLESAKEMVNVLNQFVVNLDSNRELPYLRNLSNSFINMFAILQDFNKIFSKYSLNITVLCG